VTGVTMSKTKIRRRLSVNGRVHNSTQFIDNSLADL